MAIFRLISNNDNDISNLMTTTLLYVLPWFADYNGHGMTISKTTAEIIYTEDEEEPEWYILLDHKGQIKESGNVLLDNKLSGERVVREMDLTEKSIFFVDVLTYYNILKSRSMCGKINQTFKNATINYFNETLKSLYSLEYSIHLLDSYLTTSGYVLNINIPEKIKISTLIDETLDEEIIKIYNDYVSDTQQLRQNVIDDIISKILTF
jgi:hypothetical protein